MEVLNEKTFDTAINSNLPVIVDFYADWCGPCKMIAPVLEELAKEQEGKVNIYKLNVDESPSVAERYAVRSIPTFIAFKNGEAVKTMVGAKGKQDILDMVL